MKKIIFSFVILFLTTPSLSHSQTIAFGTTFSSRQCQYLDLDWKEAYSAILDLPWDIIRLGAY